jgi:hypothetical protein
VDRALVAELVTLQGVRAELDATFEQKQPDWTYENADSGQTPVDRMADHRAD